MIKLIFKTLWSRRNRNVWIVLELVIVTMIMWVMADRLIVTSYIQNEDHGYDEDLLYTIELDQFKPTRIGYDEAQDNIESHNTNIKRILERLRQVPGVDAATVAFKNHMFNGPGRTMNGMYTLDSLCHSYFFILKFCPGTDYFATFGIKSRDGAKPYAEPQSFSGNAIITNTLARAKFPDMSPIGRDLSNPLMTPEQLAANATPGAIICDVVGDVVAYSTSARSMAAFKVMDSFEAPAASMLVARRSAEISDMEMMRNLKASIPELRSGIVYTRNPRPYTSMKESVEHKMEVSNKLSYAVMIFFIVNICIALMAAFYMQIRARSRDAGIMRAYGFNTSTLEWLMIAEGWVLTIVSWIVGTAIFFIAGFNKFFIYDNFDSDPAGSLEFYKVYNPMWYDDLLYRSLVIGSITLAVMLAIVTIGIWLPARRIAASNPADVIRDY